MMKVKLCEKRSIFGRKDRFLKRKGEECVKEYHHVHSACIDGHVGSSGIHTSLFLSQIA